MADEMLNLVIAGVHDHLAYCADIGQFRKKKTAQILMCLLKTVVIAALKQGFVLDYLSSESGTEVEESFFI